MLVPLMYAVFGAVAWGLASHVVGETKRQRDLKVILKIVYGLGEHQKAVGTPLTKQERLALIIQFAEFANQPDEVLNEKL